MVIEMQSANEEVEFAPAFGLCRTRVPLSLYGMDKIMTKLGFLFFSLIALNGMIHADDIRCMDQDLAGVHGLIPGIKGSVNLPMNYKSVEAVSGEDDGGDYTGKNWMRKLRKWAAY